MKIIGTGSALPGREVSNEELTRFLDTSDEWISTRTGIKSRRVLSDESLLQLACAASQRALDNAGLTAADIDFIIVSTVRGDWSSPGMNCALQGALGATCPGLDINGACAGFLYALDMADAYIATGRARNILVCAAEAPSRFVDWQDRATCVLFGDGAGAAVVTEGEGLLRSRLSLHSDTEVLYIRSPQGNSPFAQRIDDAGWLHMKGQDVYRAAITRSVEDIRYLLQQQGVEAADIGHCLLHQANLRIIEAVRERLKLTPEQMPHNIERTGNTSSAGCAILLDELHRSGALKPGELIVMSAFGAGFVTGALMLRWAI